MLFTRAEMEILRLCAWCKELPTRKTENLRAETVEELVAFGFLRLSRSGRSYRLTPLGYDMLQKAGFDYAVDTSYRTDDNIIIRRLQDVETASFFGRYGADVFRNTPPAEMKRDFYVSAYALRKTSRNELLRSTQMTGFYYSGDTMFVPYYVTSQDLGIYTNVEHRAIFCNSILGNRRPVVVLSGEGVFSEITQIILAPKEKSEKQTFDTYTEALDKFLCSVAVVPMNEDGIRTLEILKIDKYRMEIAKAILGEDYLPPQSDHIDAIHKKTRENYVIAVDGNLQRVRKAMTLDSGAPNIFCFDYQVDAINKYCWGDVHIIDIAEVERVFSLPRKEAVDKSVPFKTKAGKYVDVNIKSLKV